MADENELEPTAEQATHEVATELRELLENTALSEEQVERIREITTELLDLVEEHDPQLLDELEETD